MKERPIIFSKPMVTAILEGRKSQTRRVIQHRHAYCTFNAGPDGGHVHKGPARIPDGDEGLLALDWLRNHCPYGSPGDRLWVREAWRAPWEYNARPPRDIPHGVEVRYEVDHSGNTPNKWGKFRHARFMPRWASRLTLEIVSIRVERLGDCSEADAWAEGVQLDDMHTTALSAYRELWESINGPGAWGANPWVWVVEFGLSKA